jgi:hypothetical protein
MNEYQRDSFSEINNVPIRVALRLPQGYGYVDRTEQWNNSPTIAEIFKLAQVGDGTLEGYIIPFASERDDCRITFDGCTVKLPALKAYKAAHDLQPSEFTEVFKGIWHFWWD